jgi:hypothetical protein
MKHNVGSLDSVARAVLGFVIIGLGYRLNTPWGLVGLFPFLTAALAFCPLYWLFGIDTASEDEVDKHHLPPSSMKKV